jgi:hypothetical protein
VGYLIVFVIASAVGVAVYALTLREGLVPVESTSAGEPGAEASRPEGTYVSVAGGRPDWQSRLTGLIGLVVAVVLGAVALAAILYVSISSVVRIVGHLAPSASPTPGS